jgi:hypothetical protein
MQEKASSAKSVGEDHGLTTAKRRASLESCPQQADSRMGLKLVGEAACCGQLSLPGAGGLAA